MRVRFFRYVRRNKRNIPGLLWTLLTVFFIFAMIYQPAVVFQGASEGLKAWWQIIFPSLLPFFVASELLIKLGFVHFVGILLEPAMRPLFNVPGAGGFVLVMGMAGGAPVNGLLTAQLREKKICTKSESERLVCFTNFATPLFMISAVAVGMLERPELGLFIAGIHYLASIIMGLGLGFLSPARQKSRSGSTPFSLRHAFAAMARHQRSHNQTIGMLLNDAVTSSVLKLLNIGGFIILFAVIIRIFTHTGLLETVSAVFSLVLLPLGFAGEIMPSLAGGLFETTIGSSMASLSSAVEVQKVIAIGFMLGWSGLSVHAQVAGMVAGTDISLRLFFVTRIVHAFLAALLTWFLYPISHPALTVFSPYAPFYGYPAYRIVFCFFALAACLLVILVFLSLILQYTREIARSVRVFGNRRL